MDNIKNDHYYVDSSILQGDYGIHDIPLSEAYDSLVGSRYLIHLNY